MSLVIYKQLAFNRGQIGQYELDLSVGYTPLLALFHLIMVILKDKDSKILLELNVT